MICPFDSPSRDLLSWWKGLPDFLQKTLGQAASDGPRDAPWALTLLALWYTTWHADQASAASAATKDLVTIMRRATERDAAFRADVQREAGTGEVSDSALVYQVTNLRRITECWRYMVKSQVVEDVDSEEEQERLRREADTVLSEREALLAQVDAFAKAAAWLPLSAFQFGTETRHECEPGDEYPFEIVVSGACQDVVRVLTKDHGAYDVCWVVDEDDGEGPGWFVSDGDDHYRLRAEVIAWRPLAPEPELPEGWTP